MVCYLIVDPDPRRRYNLRLSNGRRGFLVKIGDGNMGSRYSIHNPSAYGVQNLNHEREDTFFHWVEGEGVDSTRDYALGKALEYQYFNWKNIHPERSEWHWVLDWNTGENDDNDEEENEDADEEDGEDDGDDDEEEDSRYMTLEEIRQNLIQALRLFPQVSFESGELLRPDTTAPRSSQRATRKFDAIMEKIGAQEG